MFAADDRLCLAVEKVPDKTVEKSTLTAILEQVDVEGAIISGDAHFTVPESAERIVHAKADYLLAVKDNQPSLSGKGAWLRETGSDFWCWILKGNFGNHFLR